MPSVAKIWMPMIWPRLLGNLHAGPKGTAFPFASVQHNQHKCCHIIVCFKLSQLDITLEKRRLDISCGREYQARRQATVMMCCHWSPSNSCQIILSASKHWSSLQVWSLSRWSLLCRYDSKAYLQAAVLACDHC